ncbi:APO_RNA-bind domain-containing protein [Cephalotus follicularis]|uniref:APO_RNA-bind domain-containing protein n=1 Tax=Cephalotus follicularis TaxID=3775 RepID=A0A1Q3AWU3_CEPFO|nr:APO_RNA-bind domain-containing protein [Cephalotus follicularis]
MKVLIRRAKEEREARKAQPCRLLQNPPDNGLLLPQLVPVAHRVYRAQHSLLFGLSKLTTLVPVQRCRFCTEVHIGHVGHEIRTCTGPNSNIRGGSHVWGKGGIHSVVFFPKCFHLYDRVGKSRVVHNERFDVPQIPAILELCIQAGVELEKYPTKRRTKPVYSIEGRIVDFESMTEEEEETKVNLYSQNIDSPFVSDFATKFGDGMKNSILEEKNDLSDHLKDKEGRDLRELSIGTMDSWFEMISGAKKIMEKYTVWTCGYCPEIQVGPKGHKVRMCKASNHQQRDGMHAWQEATIDDLVGPNYVWHVRDLNGPPLNNNLKRYYGKAPAVVELCVQAGAPVPDQYRSMMRLDVVSPDRDEVDLVA